MRKAFLSSKDIVLPRKGVPTLIVVLFHVRVYVNGKKFKQAHISGIFSFVLMIICR